MKSKWGDTPEDVYAKWQERTRLAQQRIKASEICKCRNKVIDRRNFVNRLNAARHWETKPIAVWESRYPQYEQEIFNLIEESKRLKWGDK